MTIRRQIDWGSSFERDIGYARAVVSGDWIFVSGCTGGDPVTGVMPADVETQCANTLAKIARALGDAGATFADVVRVNYILTAAADFEPCWPQLRTAFAAARPAATMIVAGLIDPAMKIEIEVTARIA